MARVTYDWNAVGHMFQFTIPDILDTSINQAVDQAAKVYTEAIFDTLASQPWSAPKSDEWTQRSGSSDLFYGQTGQFVSNLIEGKNQKGVRARYGDKKVFVGARNDVGHHSGFTMAQIALILQNTPSPGDRELFNKAYERCEDEIKAIFRRVDIVL